MLRKLVLALGLLAVAVSATGLRYEGHKVLRLTLGPEHLSVIHDVMPTTVDWWHGPAVEAEGPSHADVRVSPENYEQVTQALRNLGVEFSVMIEDVQTLLDGTMRKARSTGNAADDWFTQYHDYNATVSWLKQMAFDYPELAQMVTVGTSHEGRPLFALRITGKGAGPKPGIFNDGGIHAREWISPATVSYLIHRLLTGYGNDPEVTNMVDKFEWTMLPIFNPDGYEYTWIKDRMWRKTRKPNPGSTCVGTDPCRNAAAGWGGPGASTSPCSETYRGQAAFDQPEVKAVAEYVKNLGNVKYYNNYHSYSQLWLSPYGFQRQPPADPDYTHQITVGRLATEAIKRKHGLSYTYGPTYSTIYPASGVMVDEAYVNGKVTLSYTCELRDTGRYGFLLPPEQIIPQGEEIWEATKVIAQYILDNPSL